MKLMDVDLISKIFTKHSSIVNSQGVPVVSGSALIDVLQEIQNDCECPHDLLSAEDTGELQELISSNPEVEATPQLLAAFIRQRFHLIQSPTELPNAGPLSDTWAQGNSEVCFFVEANVESIDRFPFLTCSIKIPNGLEGGSARYVGADYLELHRCVDDLQDVNAELGSEQQKAEVRLQKLLLMHAREDQKIQKTLHEMWVELDSTKKEEDEARNTVIAIIKAEIAKLTGEFDNTRATCEMQQMKQEIEIIRGLCKTVVKMSKDKEAEWARERDSCNDSICDFQESLTMIFRVLEKIEGQMKELKEMFYPVKDQMPEWEGHDFGSTIHTNLRDELAKTAAVGTQDDMIMPGEGEENAAGEDGQEDLPELPNSITAQTVRSSNYIMEPDVYQSHIVSQDTNASAAPAETSRFKSATQSLAGTVKSFTDAIECLSNAAKSLTNAAKSVADAEL